MDFVEDYIMSWKLFVSLGTALMIVVMLFCGKYYNMKVWKRILTAVVFTAVGVLSVMIMAFIENGRWGNRSWFGAVFFAPVFMALYALIVREKPSTILDLCAPSEAAMLALMKINCSIDGCCYGYVMGMDAKGLEVRFPSQIVECVVAAIICFALIWLIHKDKIRGSAYIWYMIIYGFSRFVLNWFRATKPFIWVLPAGNFWALISLVLGLVLLFVYKNWKGRTIRST